MQTNCTIKTVSSTIENMRLITIHYWNIAGHVTCDLHYGRGVFDPFPPPALGLGEHRRGGGEVGRKRGGNFCNLFVWLTC